MIIVYLPDRTSKGLFQSTASICTPSAEAKKSKSTASKMRAAASFVTRRLKASAAAQTAQKRGMASGSHGHGGKEYPFGMHFHVSPVHKNLALAYGTMLWLWVFYRAKEDGRVVLVRFVSLCIWMCIWHVRGGRRDAAVYMRVVRLVPVVSF